MDDMSIPEMEVKLIRTNGINVVDLFGENVFREHIQSQHLTAGFLERDLRQGFGFALVALPACRADPDNVPSIGAIAVLPR